jgi:hypothetical protein
VLDELVSLEAARRDYGVALVGGDSDLQVDPEATVKLREGRG